MINMSILAEIALAGREHLDAVYVAAYDRKANLDPTEDLDQLRARGLVPASTLIDFGAWSSERRTGPGGLLELRAPPCAARLHLHEECSASSARFLERCRSPADG